VGLDQIFLITGFGGAAAPGPKNTVRPEVTGTAEEGETLTCSDGTWVGIDPIAYTYQWFRNGQAISGGTSDTYVVTLADRGFLISCVVTATDGLEFFALETDDLLLLETGDKFILETRKTSGSRSKRSNSLFVALTQFMLIESDDFLLLETGDRLKLETSA
jgi:hypothetical protein